MASSDELAWLRSLTIKDQNNLLELEESLEILISYATKDEIENIEELKNSLGFVELFVRTNNHLKLIEVRRIVRYIRKLWFLDGEENESLRSMFEQFLDGLIRSNLYDLYSESDLQRTDLQTKRCTFLISLFSYFYDDYEILGICKYDYHFLVLLIKLIVELTEKLIGYNNIKPENYLRLIYILDKIILNWLEISNVIDRDQINATFLSITKQQLAILISACKEKYKLISLSLSTILSNLDKLEKLLV